MGEAGNGADSDVLVFVYGSLKRGMAHHNQLQGARWQGDAELAGLALHDLGPFPMAVDDAGADQPLRGELYSVSAALLEQLDRFEGAPRLYERQWRTLSDGRGVWVYVGRARQVRHAPLIVSGCWQEPQPRLKRAQQPPASAPPPPTAQPAPKH
jgi:gamma-glutamylcyclotransferase (GGCT)/AIG2-like uncharacterized protein YtfP